MPRVGAYLSIYLQRRENRNGKRGGGRKRRERERVTENERVGSGGRVA